MKIIRPLVPVVLLLFITALTPYKGSVKSLVEQIDNKAALIDSSLKHCDYSQFNCCDCFDSYTFTDKTGVVKVANRGSCYNIDFYYSNSKLILVTIDGSFVRDCGYTEANYCWDTTLIRNYTDRIYYNEGRVIKEDEHGVSPCCPIYICPYTADSIPQSAKASELYKRYGRIWK